MLEGFYQEGGAAYVLGSSRSDNPYAKAKRNMMGNPKIKYDDATFAMLMEGAMKWDSGFSMEKARRKRTGFKRPKMGKTSKSKI